jgi:methionyl-tRNA synthetase
MEARLHDVCTVCIEAFAVLTSYLKPVLPALATQVETFLRIPPLSFASASQPLGAGHSIGSYQHLMQRVDIGQLEALFEAPAPVGPHPNALPKGEGVK